MSTTTELVPETVVSSTSVTTEIVVTLGPVPSTETYSYSSEAIFVQQNVPVPISLSMTIPVSATIS